MTETEKCKVVVLFGGFTDERPVSLLSAKNVLLHLSPELYLVSSIDVISENEWHFLGEQGAKRVLHLDNAEDCAFLKTFDVFFNVLHGGFGEDGRLQSFLDTLGACYTGSGVEASQLTINKVETMKKVMALGMKVPLFFSINKDTRIEEITKNIQDQFGYPVIMKPNNGGSTLGLSLVQREDGLAAALEKAFQFSQEVIVQQYIFGREFTCGVLGNSSEEGFLTLPPVEIIIKNQIFDFNDKYFSKETQEICPAPISRDVTKKIEELALKAHHALGCDGLSRSDFRMNGKEDIFFLETNTSPGMTDMSLCPREALAYGMAMPQFLDRIIALARSRCASRA